MFKIVKKEIELDGKKISLETGKIAKAFVLPLGGKNASEAIDKLKEFSFIIRKVLSKKISMKFLPKLLFVKDESFDYDEKIENLIKQTNKYEKRKDE